MPEHEWDADTISLVHRINDEIQDWATKHESSLPAEFLQLLSDLDWALNGP